MNLPLVLMYLYLTRVRQLGPSWVWRKGGGGCGWKEDGAGFSFFFRNNNDPKRSDLVSF